MKEKKQFFIPKNYTKKFEWIPGISGWQHVAFLPVIAVDYLIIQYAPFSFSNKVTFIAVSLGLPWLLIGTHPIRENVPLYKHLLWRLKFMKRQRQFHYKKEGYAYVQYVEERSKGNSEESGKSKKDDSRLNTGEGDRTGVIDHPGKQSGDVSPSVSHKLGINIKRRVQ